MTIREVASWDAIQEPGDFIFTKTERGERTGIVLMCVCGEVISCSRHTIEQHEPLTVSPSIGHIVNGTMTCHYFIRHGKHVPA